MQDGLLIVRASHAHKINTTQQAYTYTTHTFNTKWHNTKYQRKLWWLPSSYGSMQVVYMDEWGPKHHSHAPCRQIHHATQMPEPSKFNLQLERLSIFLNFKQYPWMTWMLHWIDPLPNLHNLLPKLPATRLTATFRLFRILHQMIWIHFGKSILAVHQPWNQCRSRIVIALATQPIQMNVSAGYPTQLYHCWMSSMKWLQQRPSVTLVAYMISALICQPARPRHLLVKLYPPFNLLVELYPSQHLLMKLCPPLNLLVELYPTYPWLRSVMQLLRVMIPSKSLSTILWIKPISTRQSWAIHIVQMPIHRSRLIQLLKMLRLGLPMLPFPRTSTISSRPIKEIVGQPSSNFASALMFILPVFLQAW